MTAAALGTGCLHLSVSISPSRAPYLGAATQADGRLPAPPPLPLHHTYGFLQVGCLFSCMQWLRAADTTWVVREDLQADSFLLLVFLPPVCCSLRCLYSPLTLGCNTCVPKQSLVMHLLAGGGCCSMVVPVRAHVAQMHTRSAACTAAKQRRHKAASSALGMRKT